MTVCIYSTFTLYFWYLLSRTLHAFLLLLDLEKKRKRKSINQQSVIQFVRVNKVPQSMYLFSNFALFVTNKCALMQMKQELLSHKASQCNTQLSGIGEMHRFLISKPCVHLCARFLCNDSDCLSTCFYSCVVTSKANVFSAALLVYGHASLSASVFVCDASTVASFLPPLGVCLV